MNIDSGFIKSIDFKKYINEKVKKIYLHIGFHKTATSSIQQTLYSNKKKLMQNDIYYSSNQKAANAFTLFGLFCDDVKRYDYHKQRGHNQQQIEEFNSDNLIELLKEIKYCKQKTFLFSEEHLSTIVNLDNIKELKDFIRRLMPKADICLICCVRDPIKFYVSSFQQRVGGNLIIIPKNNEFNTSKLNYFKYKISGYLNVFNRENIVVYKFEDACSDKNGPVGYFLKNILELSDRTIKKIKIIKANEGRSIKALELISYCNEKIPYYVNGMKSDKREFADTHSFAKVRGNKLTIPVDVQKKIFESMYDDIIWLKNQFGVDYSQPDYGYKESVEVYGEEYYQDIISIFPRLTDTIQQLVYAFLNEKIEEVNDEESKKWLSELSKTLKSFLDSKSSPLISIQQNFEWFINVQKEENKGIPQIYRNIAIFCELHGEIQAAKTLMGIAKDYAPNGKVINEKYEEYNQILEKGEETKRIFVK